MTQNDYKLFTGETVTFTDEDWGRLVGVVSKRFASFLCLESLPDPLPDDLLEVLANFMYLVLAHHGKDAQVEEKRVRNFTIKFTESSAANAFAKVAHNYGDTIDRYSDCGIGFRVERSEPECCRYGRL